VPLITFTAAQSEAPGGISLRSFRSFRSREAMPPGAALWAAVKEVVPSSAARQALRIPIVTKSTAGFAEVSPRSAHSSSS